MEGNYYKISSLSEAKEEIIKLKSVSDLSTVNWSLYKILIHCAQTIEYSMNGYPQLKPKIIRLTVGKIAINKFLKDGYMKHDLKAPVPGAPEIPEQGHVNSAIEKIITVIDNFTNYSGELYPHLLFGKLSKNQYDQYFSMHIADHLSEIKYLVLT